MAQAGYKWTPDKMVTERRAEIAMNALFPHVRGAEPDCPHGADCVACVAAQMRYNAKRDEVRAAILHAFASA